MGMGLRDAPVRAGLAFPRMTERGRWLLIVLGWCAALALLLEAPQLLRILRPEYRGILPTLNADEDVYRARVQEALSGRPGLAAEAFVGDPAIRGTQPAVLEAGIGILFLPLGWSAPAVLQALDAVIPPLLFLAIVAFLGLSGLPRAYAVAGAIAFTLLELYNLNRPIHQAGSTLVVFTAFDGILLGLRSRRPLPAIAGGALLGVTFGMTFWPWSFAWTWWGLMLLWAIAVAPHARRMLLWAGAAGSVVALPFLLDLNGASHHPAWADAVFRSGMHPGRLPESGAYSALFLIMAAGALSLRRFTPVIMLVLASTLLIHQQLFHGQVFNFVSHYLLFMAVAAVACVLVALRERHAWPILGALAACVYLLAIGYDGRHVLKQWNPAATDWSSQRFADILPALDELPRARILTDPETSALVASFTPHDVLYSIYLKNVLLTHRQLAEHFCLTQLPVPPEERRIAEREHLLWPDANGAFRNPAIRAEEVRLVEEVCAELDRDPAGSLRRHGVTTILWDERGRPEWQLDRLQIPLTKVVQAEGWSLWVLNDQ